MTKYCSFFVKGLSCPNNDCLYLHKLAGEGDCCKKIEGGVKYISKVSPEGIIDHIISKNKEFWKINNKAKMNPIPTERSFPGLSSAWRKIRGYCKQRGISFTEKEKEKTKIVKVSTKTEKKSTSHLIKTSKWSHEEELPIFSRRNVFGDDDDSEEEEILDPLPLKKTTSVRVDYVSKKKDVFISKSGIDFTKKEKSCKEDKGTVEQVFTPQGKDKHVLSGFGSPKSELNNQTSVHAKNKTDKRENANQKTLDTQSKLFSNTGETEIEDEIEQVFDQNSSEYTELDKKIFSLLGKSYNRLKKEESEIDKRDHSLSVSSKKDIEDHCQHIKKVIDNFLKPNKELLSAKREEKAKVKEKENDTHFRLFGQSYKIQINRH